MLEGKVLPAWSGRFRRGRAGRFRRDGVLANLVVEIQRRGIAADRDRLAQRIERRRQLRQPLVIAADETSTSSRQKIRFAPRTVQVHKLRAFRPASLLLSTMRVRLTTASRSRSTKLRSSPDGSNFRRAMTRASRSGRASARLRSPTGRRATMRNGLSSLSLLSKKTRHHGLASASRRAWQHGERRLPVAHGGQGGERVTGPAHRKDAGEIILGEIGRQVAAALIRRNDDLERRLEQRHRSRQLAPDAYDRLMRQRAAVAGKQTAQDGNFAMRLDDRRAAALFFPWRFPPPVRPA